MLSLTILAAKSWGSNATLPCPVRNLRSQVALRSRRFAFRSTGGAESAEPA
jgi:hypothetical protein